MPLINCQINLVLTWSARYFIIDAPLDGQEPTLRITDTNCYAPVVTSSTEDNAKLLQQFKSSLKGTINWSKYQLKITVQKQNLYLDFLLILAFKE